MSIQEKVAARRAALAEEAANARQAAHVEMLEQKRIKEEDETRLRKDRFQRELATSPRDTHENIIREEIARRWKNSEQLILIALIGLGLFTIQFAGLGLLVLLLAGFTSRNVNRKYRHELEAERASIAIP